MFQSLRRSMQSHKYFISSPTLSVSCGIPHLACRRHYSSSTTSVYAVGHNTHGCLGINSKEKTLKVPQKIPNKFFRNANIVKLDAYSGGTHVTALTDQGHLYVWGQNACGQLGLGDRNNKYGPLPSDALTHATNAACGEHHTLILSNDQKLYSCGYGGSKIFGMSSFLGLQLKSDALGYSTNGNQLTPKEVETMRGKNIVSIDCGEYHSGAVTDQGELYMWGRGDWGRLGNGSNRSWQIPQQLTSETFASHDKFQKIVCGHAFSMALSTQGAVFSWGKNENSQLGVGEQAMGQITGGAQFDCEKSPVFLPNDVHFGGRRVVDIDCGTVTSAAIDEDNNFYYWGRTLQSPTLIEKVGKVSAMSVGKRHALLISQDGEVFMVGALGALGNRQHVENITSQIPTTGKVVQVVAGSDFSLFLCEEE
uniref:Uncharacterized protein n=1 Tax=Percolomonas cosmopolitus TaxID=63605 RepID=A0A7S1KQ48_9EUKA|mmetsp:Transcript_2483/g.9340  ORF Transcript_2483/g.9340 Transcript_2483/m.9340 type:complete len:422 (+) Transcript_2483:46-1311(+)